MSGGLEIFYYAVSTILTATSLIIMFVKPIREYIFGLREEKEKKQKLELQRQETDRCLLRSGILSVYYSYCSECEIKQYNYENVGLMYQQYKKLGGNSFVDKIWDEMQEWKVIR